jgi:hypothetical protein
MIVTKDHDRDETHPNNGPAATQTRSLPDRSTGANPLCDDNDSWKRKPMELFNNLQKKARDLIAGNEEAIKEGIEKVGDFVDEQTDGKFAEQVDLVQGAASDYVAKIDEDTDAASAGDVDRQQ